MVTVIVDIYYHSSVGAYIAGLRAPSAKGRHGNTSQIKSRIMFSADLLNGWQRAVPFCMICSLDMVTGLPWTKQTRACELDSCPIFQLASLAPVHCTYYIVPLLGSSSLGYSRQENYIHGIAFPTSTRPNNGEPVLGPNTEKQTYTLSTNYVGNDYSGTLTP